MTTTITAPAAGLSDRERWLLRLAHAGLLDTSDLARHTGLSAAQVNDALAGAVAKLGTSTLADALEVVDAPVRPHAPAGR